MRSFCLLTLALAVVAGPGIAAQGQTRNESEPNNTMAVANVVGLGDTLTGHLDNDDRDVFKIHLDSGVALHVQVIPGSNTPAVPQLLLLDSAGYSLRGTASLMSHGQDRSIWFPITRSGDYFVQVPGPLGSQGGSSYRLRILNEPAPPAGHGDPWKIIATGMLRGGMVAASDGDFYVATRTAIVRVPKSGGASTFASFGGGGATLTGAIAIDAEGDFLVGGDSTSGVVWRVPRSGPRSVLYRSTGGCCAHAAMAVAPNGDLWVSQGALFVQIDKQGMVKDTIEAVSSSMGPMCSNITFMALSPAGEVHYTVDKCGGIFKLSGNKTPTRVFDANATMLGPLAFDEDGYLYVMSGLDGGRIMVLDPQYRVNEDYWASRLHGSGGIEPVLTGLAFARDRASGNTMARLFLAYDGPQGDGNGGWVIEFNKDGIRAPGWPVGYQAETATQMSVAGGALRSGTRGKSYADTLKTKDAPGSVAWSITSGTLPPGVAFDGPKGTLSGTPTDTGWFAFDAKAASGSQSATGHFTIHILSETQMEISVADIATALLGGAALSGDQVAYLDGHGNHNGVLDIGDLRAYLRARGMLAGGKAP